MDTRLLRMSTIKSVFLQIPFLCIRLKLYAGHNKGNIHKGQTLQAKDSRRESPSVMIHVLWLENDLNYTRAIR